MGQIIDFESKKEIEQTWIYRHNLQTGEKKVLAKPKKSGYIVPSMSTDGNLIIYSRKDRTPAGRQIWLVDIEGQNDRELLNVGDDLKAYAAWIPGEHKLLVLAETKTIEN